MYMMMWPDGRLIYEKGEWVWSGGPIALVHEGDLYRSMDYEAYTTGRPVSRKDDKGILTLGKYRVRELQRLAWPHGIWVVKDDWRAPFWIVWDRFGRTLVLLKVCIIRAACIWQLSFKPEGERYCWRNIYMIDWLARHIKKE